MDHSLKSKLIVVLSSSTLKREDAAFVADVLQDISLTTKLYVTVFAVGLVQILAIIGAVLAIINAGKTS